MRAGLLRHTIAIQEHTLTDNDMGGFSESWATVSGMGKVRASVWPMKSTEQIDAMKLELKTTHRIRIRYRSGINAAMRIYWSDKGKTFNIVSIINPDERNRMLEFLAVEDV